MPAAVVLLAQVLDVGPVAGEARGTGLQALQSEALGLVPAGDVGWRREAGGLGIAEVLQELRTADAAQPLVGIAHDLVAARGEDVGGQPVVAAGDHAVAGLQVEVVAAVEGLLAVGGDVGAEVVLVGRLVVGEAGVAIEPVGAVLHGEVQDRGVEGDDAAYGLLDALLEVGTDGIVLLAVFLEPLAVVVLSQLPQILQYSFCIHNITISTFPHFSFNNELKRDLSKTHECSQ